MRRIVVNKVNLRKLKNLQKTSINNNDNQPNKSNPSRQPNQLKDVKVSQKMSNLEHNHPKPTRKVFNEKSKEELAIKVKHDEGNQAKIEGNIPETENKREKEEKPNISKHFK